MNWDGKTIGPEGPISMCLTHAVGRELTEISPRHRPRPASFGIGEALLSGVRGVITCVQLHECLFCMQGGWAQEVADLNPFGDVVDSGRYMSAKRLELAV